MARSAGGGGGATGAGIGAPTMSGGGQPQAGTAVMARLSRAMVEYLPTLVGQSLTTGTATLPPAPGADSGSSVPIDRPEEVVWAGFDVLDAGPLLPRRKVLILAYATGFQIWDCQEPTSLKEIVSRRQGPVISAHMLPHPSLPDEGPLVSLRPLVAVLTNGDGAAPDGSPAGDGGVGMADEAYSGGAQRWAVRFYSMVSHSYVHELAFPRPVLAVRCSRRLVVVGQPSQIYAFDASTLHKVFSVQTFPALQSAHVAAAAGAGSGHYGSGLAGSPSSAGGSPAGAASGQFPLALGSRWLAYAGNQPANVAAGRAHVQHFSRSPGPSPSTSPADPTSGGAALVAHFAKRSGRQLAAGIASLGDIGYKTLQGYYRDLRTDAPGRSSPGLAGGYLSSPGAVGSGGVGGGAGAGSVGAGWRSVVGAGSQGALSRGPYKAQDAGQPGAAARNSHGGAPATSQLPVDAEIAGTVVVRDVVTRAVVAEFRAHNSPLSHLAFDPSGTLLVTASVCGNNLNVFRLHPPGAANQSREDGAVDDAETFSHLFKLYRGVTPAVIQDISFSACSRWVAVSTSRGTTHVYAIAPFGGPIGFATHMARHTYPWRPAPTLGGGGMPVESGVGGVRTLSALNRIKSNQGWWRDTVSGAAAAATGWTFGNSGAVASVFLPAIMDEEEDDLVLERLLILSPGGRLGLYHLRPEAATAADGMSEALRLGVEPVKQWLVNRRSSWSEREEMVADCLRAETRLGRSRDAPRWMACAEIATQPLPMPLWASHRFEFYTISAEEAARAQESGPSSRWTDVPMESLPWTHVEVRRGELKPLVEQRVPAARSPAGGADSGGGGPNGPIYPTPPVFADGSGFGESGKALSPWLYASRPLGAAAAVAPAAAGGPSAGPVAHHLASGAAGGTVFSRTASESSSASSASQVQRLPDNLVRSPPRQVPARVSSHDEDCGEDGSGSAAAGPSPGGAAKVGKGDDGGVWRLQEAAAGDESGSAASVARGGSDGTATKSDDEDGWDVNSPLDVDCEEEQS